MIHVLSFYFQFYNKSLDYLGAHNKDKLGQTSIPLMVKVEKKKLSCSEK
jgi:hypothetical protein